MSVKEDNANLISNEIIKILNKSGVEETSIIIENPPTSDLGDMAVPMFKYSKMLKQSPAVIAEKVAADLRSSDLVERIDIKGGYLNIFLKRNSIASKILSEIVSKKENFGNLAKKDENVLVEFSCPNTNKPLHLGHCRNNVLGDAVSRIYNKAGYNVKKVNLINDRGIHICKSMIAYKYWGNGTTPESVGKKSDHFVGDYYVKYAVESEKNKDLEKEAQDMLLLWEQKDKVVIDLWKKMNNWAIDGIKDTYKKMKIDFDYYQFESNTYIYGKDIINKGLENGVFYKEPDNSIWVNNEDVGLDKKILLRNDGTSIYITQDIGTAVKRNEEFGFDRMIYVVGSEQIYHFQTLFAILKKLGYKWAESCYHLSYGMVNLPEGKMKSREGKVIDADNLIDLLTEMASESVNEKHPEWSAEEKADISEKIGLSALKYYLLNFTTSKDVMFMPEKSISFDGNTGPYLQYVTARINSLLSKAGVDVNGTMLPNNYNFVDSEWNIILKLLDFEKAIEVSAANYSPMEICAYLYDLTKLFNKFYHDLPILNAENQDEKNVRLLIVKSVDIVLKNGLELLGIEPLERM